MSDEVYFEQNPDREEEFQHAKLTLERACYYCQHNIIQYFMPNDITTFGLNPILPAMATLHSITTSHYSDHETDRAVHLIQYLHSLIPDPTAALEKGYIDILTTLKAKAVFFEVFSSDHCYASDQQRCAILNKYFPSEDQNKPTECSMQEGYSTTGEYEAAWHSSVRDSISQMLSIKAKRKNFQQTYLLNFTKSRSMRESLAEMVESYVSEIRKYLPLPQLVVSHIKFVQQKVALYDGVWSGHSPSPSSAASLRDEPKKIFLLTPSIHIQRLPLKRIQHTLNNSNRGDISEDNLNHQGSAIKRRIGSRNSFLSSSSSNDNDGDLDRTWSRKSERLRCKKMNRVQSCIGKHDNSDSDGVSSDSSQFMEERRKPTVLREKRKETTPRKLCLTTSASLDGNSSDSGQTDLGAQSEGESGGILKLPLAQVSRLAQCKPRSSDEYLSTDHSKSDEIMNLRRRPATVQSLKRRSLARSAKRNLSSSTRTSDTQEDTGEERVKKQSQEKAAQWRYENDTTSDNSEEEREGDTVWGRASTRPKKRKRVVRNARRKSSDNTRDLTFKDVLVSASLTSEGASDVSSSSKQWLSPAVLTPMPVGSRVKEEEIFYAEGFSSGGGKGVDAESDDDGDVRVGSSGEEGGSEGERLGMGSGGCDGEQRGSGGDGSGDTGSGGDDDMEGVRSGGGVPMGDAYSGGEGLNSGNSPKSNQVLADKTVRVGEEQGAMNWEIWEESCQKDMQHNTSLNPLCTSNHPVTDNDVHLRRAGVASLDKPISEEIRIDDDDDDVSHSSCSNNSARSPSPEGLSSQNGDEELTLNPEPLLTATGPPDMGPSNRPPSHSIFEEPTENTSGAIVLSTPYQTLPAASVPSPKELRVSTSTARLKRFLSSSGASSEDDSYCPQRKQSRRDGDEEEGCVSDHVSYNGVPPWKHQDPKQSIDLEEEDIFGSSGSSEQSSPMQTDNEQEGKAGSIHEATTATNNWRFSNPEPLIVSLPNRYCGGDRDDEATPSPMSSVDAALTEASRPLACSPDIDVGPSELVGSKSVACDEEDLMDDDNEDWIIASLNPFVEPHPPLSDEEVESEGVEPTAKNSSQYLKPTLRMKAATVIENSGGVVSPGKATLAEGSGGVVSPGRAAMTEDSGGVVSPGRAAMTEDSGGVVSPAMTEDSGGVVSPGRAAMTEDSGGVVSPAMTEGSGGVVSPGMMDVSGGVVSPERATLEEGSGGVVSPGRAAMTEDSGGVVSPGRAAMTEDSGGVVSPGRAAMTEDSGGVVSPGRAAMTEDSGGVVSPGRAAMTEDSGGVVSPGRAAMTDGSGGVVSPGRAAMTEDSGGVVSPGRAAMTDDSGGVVSPGRAAMTDDSGGVVSPGRAAMTEDSGGDTVLLESFPIDNILSHLSELLASNVKKGKPKRKSRLKTPVHTKKNRTPGNERSRSLLKPEKSLSSQIKRLSLPSPSSFRAAEKPPSSIISLLTSSSPSPVPTNITEPEVSSPLGKNSSSVLPPKRGESISLPPHPIPELSEPGQHSVGGNTPPSHALEELNPSTPVESSVIYPSPKHSAKNDQPVESPMVTASGIGPSLAPVEMSESSPSPKPLVKHSTGNRNQTLYTLEEQVHEISEENQTSVMMEDSSCDKNEIPADKNDPPGTTCSSPLPAKRKGRPPKKIESHSKLIPSLPAVGKKKGRPPKKTHLSPSPLPNTTGRRKGRPPKKMKETAPSTLAPPKRRGRPPKKTAQPSSQSELAPKKKVGIPYNKKSLESVVSLLKPNEELSRSVLTTTDRGDVVNVELVKNAAYLVDDSICIATSEAMVQEEKDDSSSQTIDTASRQTNDRGEGTNMSKLTALLTSDLQPSSMHHENLPTSVERDHSYPLKTFSSPEIPLASPHTIIRRRNRRVSKTMGLNSTTTSTTIRVDKDRVVVSPKENDKSSNVGELDPEEMEGVFQKYDPSVLVRVHKLIQDALLKSGTSPTTTPPRENNIRAPSPPPSPPPPPVSVASNHMTLFPDTAPCRTGSHSNQDCDVVSDSTLESDAEQPRSSPLDKLNLLHELYKFQHSLSGKSIAK